MSFPTGRIKYIRPTRMGCCPTSMIETEPPTSGPEPAASHSQSRMRLVEKRQHSTPARQMNARHVGQTLALRRCRIRECRPDPAA